MYTHIHTYRVICLAYTIEIGSTKVNTVSYRGSPCEPITPMVLAPDSRSGPLYP